MEGKWPGRFQLNKNDMQKEAEKRKRLVTWEHEGEIKVYNTREEI